MHDMFQDALEYYLNHAGDLDDMMMPYGDEYELVDDATEEAETGESPCSLGEAKKQDCK
jgi:hypothetical protein